jgi:hypothetical protein
MEWRTAAQRFGVRFAICLLVLGTAYLAIFGLKPTSHNIPITASQKVAALRAGLDETYIVGNDLAGFKESDSVAANTLGSMFSQYQNAYTSLQTALSKAPGEVTAVTRSSVRSILTRQKQAINTYQVAGKVLSQIITYEPSTDLGSLDANKNTADLTARATAAQQGLTHAANDTTPSANSGTGSLSVQSADSSNLIVSGATKKALLTEAGCFGQITTQLNAHQITQAVSTRSHCINAYPALRLQVAQNITQPAFGGVYQNYMGKTVPSLLETLNKLARR